MIDEWGFICVCGCENRLTVLLHPKQKELTVSIVDDSMKEVTVALNQKETKKLIKELQKTLDK